MRLLQIVTAAALTAALVSACGGKKVETASPKGIPYLCADGRPMRVVYDGGGARATAKLMFDGGSFKMSAAPTVSGLRYASESGLNEGQALVWTTDGVNGTLSEVPAAQAGLGDEREIVRCERMGWDGQSDVPPEEHADHGEEAH